jgi:hypothetical protein
LTEMRTLSLPATLCQRAQEKFGEKFESVEQLLESILTELLRDDAAQADHEEQLVIEQRLRDLGYL